MSTNRGLVNTVINKLPFEAHIPGYQFCGPGTKLKHRLTLGHSGINPLDKACRVHDIQYNQHSDLVSRHRADQVLEQEAFKRLKSKDATLSEKSAALLVGNVMRLKRKIGAGHVMKKRKKQVRHRRKRRVGSGIRKKPFRSTVVKPVISAYKNSGKTLSYKDALKIARNAVRRAGGRRKILVPRIIPVPKTGGFLPFLIPLFAGLGAIGSIAGGASAIASTINKAKAAKAQLEEAVRHNKNMEAIALGRNTSLGKRGNGLGLYISKN